MKKYYNGFTLIAKDNKVLARQEPEVIVYAYLLSELRTDDEYLYHPSTVDEIPKYLHIPQDQIESGLRKLTDLGYVKVVDSYPCLGPYFKENGKVELYTNIVTEDTEREENILQKWYKSYKVICKSTGREGQAKNCFDRLYVLLDKGITRMNCNDFITFYNSVYELRFEEYKSEVTGKARGIMKNLLKYYDPITLFKIIVIYFENIEKYTNKGPTLESLMYHREAIFLQTKNKSVRFKHSVSEDIDEPVTNGNRQKKRPSFL